MKPFVAPHGDAKKSYKLSQVMSLESVLFGADDYKFENENLLKCRSSLFTA